MSNSTDDVIRNEFRKFLRQSHPDNFDTVPLAELGIDSLSFFETTMVLEDEHGIIIPDAQLHSSITLAEIFTIAERKPTS